MTQKDKTIEELIEEIKLLRKMDNGTRDSGY